jgi:hypothetical protein
VAPPPDAEYRLQQEGLAAGRWPVGAGCATGEGGSVDLMRSETARGYCGIQLGRGA